MGGIHYGPGVAVPFVNCEAVPFCAVVGDEVDIFYSFKRHYVFNALGMVPHFPLPFEVPNQVNGGFPGVAAELQGPSVLEYFGEEGCIVEHIDCIMVV